MGYRESFITAFDDPGLAFSLRLDPPSGQSGTDLGGGIL